MCHPVKPHDKDDPEFYVCHEVTLQIRASHQRFTLTRTQKTQIERGQKLWKPGGLPRGITHAAVSSGYFCLQSVSQEAGVSRSDQARSLIHRGLRFFCCFNLWAHFK